VNKRILTPKKDQFKAVKGSLKDGFVKSYKAPDFLNKMYHVSFVNENGLFTMKDNIYTMLYKIIPSAVSERSVFEVLRGYDFEYRFFYYGIDEIYMEILIKASPENKSIDMDMIEKDMFDKMTGFGISLMGVNLDDRLRLIHKKVCRHNDDVNKNVMNYVNDTGAWKDDIALKQYVPHENTLEMNHYTYLMAFIKEFPKADIRTFIEHVLSTEGVECVMIQYSPVSDDSLRAFFNSNYMGCDNELRKLINRNGTLYRILSDDTASDSRSYCFMGINILYAVTAEDKAVKKETIDFVVDRYDAEISYYQTNPLDTFTEFIPLGKWNYNQSRLFLNDDIKDTMLITGAEKTEEYISSEFFI